MNPWLIVAALLAVLGAGAGGFKLGADHEVAARAREDAHITQAIDKATEVSAQAIAALKPKYTTIQGKLEKTIETHTVFRDCRLDPVGLQLANQALDPGGAYALGGSKLPRVDPTP